MVSTLVRGKYIICKITSPVSAEIISDGAVFQRDGEIIAVGKYKDLREQYTPEETIGSSNYVVMPGLINAHYHCGLSPFQRGVPDLPLELWLPAQMGEKEVDPYLDHLYGATQMLKSGTTVVQELITAARPADFAASEKMLKACQESGIRVSFARMVYDQNRLVAGSRGGEEDFTSQLPTGLAERFKSFMAQAYLSTEVCG